MDQTKEHGRITTTTTKTQSVESKHPEPEDSPPHHGSFQVHEVSNSTYLFVLGQFWCNIFISIFRLQLMARRRKCLKISMLKIPNIPKRRTAATTMWRWTTPRNEHCAFNPSYLELQYFYLLQFFSAFFFESEYAFLLLVTLSSLSTLDHPIFATFWTIQINGVAI